MQSIYDVAKKDPDKWLRLNDCQTEDQKLDLYETGGMLQWCSCCECHNSPNRPCFCGCLVIKRQSDGLYWGGENGWIEDWKYHTEHFFSLDSAYGVASVLNDDNDTLSIYVIKTNWQKDIPTLELK